VFGTEDPIIAKSSKMRQVLATARRVAGTDATVLLRGESGVGKDVVAKLIANYSPRSQRGFLKLDCNTIPQELVESELFGYVKGAFTGAKSGGSPGILEAIQHGTLFVDEVGDIPLKVQGKFLRLLEEGLFRRIGATCDVAADVRIIAATNRNLEDMIAKGLFRKDLYYRVNVVPITIPPLRERKDDIAPLVQFYLTLFNHRYGGSKSLSEEVMSHFRAYPWPGNVRELIHVVERIVITVVEDLIRLEHVKGLDHKTAANRSHQARRSSLKESVQLLERDMLITAMQEHGSSRSMAKSLGISHTSVLKKLKKYGLTE
jgi:TyrR family helix-turn-helix protein